MSRVASPRRVLMTLATATGSGAGEAALHFCEALRRDGWCVDVVWGPPAREQDGVAAKAAMQAALAKDPSNADFHSLYAYSLRKGGTQDMDLVFKHYNEALRIDPRHKGAHEYLGEAYLMVGNVAKAKEHLAQLDKICFFSCSEFNDLKGAISDYEAKTTK